MQPDLKQLERDLERMIAQAQTYSDIVATEALKFYTDSFARQGFINTRYQRWRDRRGGARNAGRGILEDSGNLRGSLRSRTYGNIAEVYTHIKYAKIHNEGGVIAVSSRMRRYFWAMYKATGQPHYKYMALSKEITIPQRQFMDIEGKGMSPFLERRIGMHLGKEIAKVWHL